MQPIRILHVFGSLGSGGAESRTMDIYREIDKNKVQFDFLIHTNNKGFFEDEITRMGGKVYRVPRLGLQTLLSYPKAVIKFYQSHPEFKIIHGHLLSTSFIYLSIAKARKVPVRIAHSRCASRAEKDIVNKIKNATEKLSRFYATHLFAVSKLAGIDAFGKKRVEQKKVKIIPNAINSKKFTFDANKRKTFRNKLNLKDNFVVGHIGRFVTQKNHFFLLEIFSRILKIRPEAKLMLVGDGAMRPKIEGKIEQLKIKSSIILLGIRDDVGDLLQAMDVLLLPSIQEGFPGVVLEAQAAGLPCVISSAITDEVKLTELVEYVPLKNSSEDWAKKVIHASEPHNRINTYDDIVTAGYDIIEVAKWYETFYLNTIEKNIRPVKARLIGNAKKEYRNYDS